MIQRCTDVNSDKYHRYGGRGITVCDSWRVSFTAFLSDMGERPAGMTLNRVNNNEGYSKENCKWATPKEQMDNHPGRKLSEEDVLHILHLYQEGELTQYQLADYYGVDQSHISDIINGKKR